MDKIVTTEIATEEITKWLDKKKVFQSTRDKQQEQIDLLVEAVTIGVLTLNEDTFELTHTLQIPVGEGTVTQLVYKSRLTDAMIRPKMAGIKSDDGDGRVNAMLSALTGAPKGTIDSLDSIDKKIANAIIIFFI